MIKDEQLISDINGKRLHVIDLVFETTWRCNLKCGHCYKEDAKPVDIHPKVPDIVLDYFRCVHEIRLHGGESQLNPKGLSYINSALARHKTKFNNFSLITNGTFVNDEFFEILEEINTKAERRIGGGVLVGISDTIWHDEAYLKVGLTREDVFNNYTQMKKKHPKLRIFFDDRRTRKSSIHAVGRAKEFDGTDKNITRNEFKFHYGRLLRFKTDPRGNAIQSWRENHVGSDKSFGNILKKPIPDMLIEHGIG